MLSVYFSGFRWRRGQSGKSAAGVLTGAGLVDSNAKANVTIPATLCLSAHHGLSPAWTVMADFTRTYWSDLPELRVRFDSAQADSVVTLGLKDANRYSIGLIYAPGGAWTYRTGLALDEAQINWN